MIKDYPEKIRSLERHAIDVYQNRSAECPALKNVRSKKGGSGGLRPQTLTRSYYFEPPLSKKRSRATAPIGVR